MDFMDWYLILRGIICAGSDVIPCLRTPRPSGWLGSRPRHWPFFLTPSCQDMLPGALNECKTSSDSSLLFSASRHLVSLNNYIITLLLSRAAVLIKVGAYARLVGCFVLL